MRLGLARRICSIIQFEVLYDFSQRNTEALSRQSILSDVTLLQHTTIVVPVLCVE